MSKRRTDNDLEKLIDAIIKQVGKEVYPRREELRDDLLAYGTYLLIALGLAVFGSLTLIALVELSN